MNKKGQALVEFIIIMPVMIFILMVIVDLGTITYNKNKMENMTNDIKKMYENEETEEEINRFIKKNDKNISLKIEKNNKYTTIKLEEKYDYLTPGLDKIMKNNKIIVEREIYNE